MTRDETEAPASIAKRLTGDARALLTDPGHFAIDDAARENTRAFRRLSKLGLVHTQLSPLGQQVAFEVLSQTRFVP
jgi:hypothetical protein